MHYRLLRAYEQAFQDGSNPTDGVIAKLLGLKRRETVCRWRQASPLAHLWILEQLHIQAVAAKPLVDRRVTHLAVTGSPEHARIFYQFVANLGDRGELPAQGEGHGGVTINLLVPRPEMPAGMHGSTVAASAAPMAIDAVQARRIAGRL